MGVDILNIGVSGLSAAQRQLMTTSHNVSNVNTEGYSRQSAEQEATLPSYYTGTGFIGTGVSVQTTVRMSDEFLERQIREANSDYGQYNAFYDMASQIDDLLADPQTGLTPTIESFYSALQEANDDPSSNSTRQVLLSEANVLTDRFQLIDNRFVELNNQVNEHITNITNEISTIAKTIARFNVEIIRLTGIGNGNTPNDILDQREVLIKELSKKIDISVVYQDDGAANIFIGSGQTLVISGTAATMSSEINKYNSLQQDIILTRGNAKEYISGSISGGELDGILNFREELLYPSINSLGRIAIALSEEMNTQNRLGMTLQARSEPFPLGDDFFSSLTNVPQVLDGQNNSTGIYSAAIDDSKILTISDYQLDVTAAGAGYQLTRLSDNSILYSGAVLTELQDAALQEGFSIAETSIPSV
ncbi:MAG: flagellar hook-associated protein FlgK, partial [Thiotrichaceae bacterium]|nr:flagellar hook-associated protein FlgK [Thiotrichaceae bacterium]